MNVQNMINRNDIKPRHFLLAIFFLVISAINVSNLHAQSATNNTIEKQALEDIESSSHGDSKQVKPRTLQYLPDGEDFVCINGNNKYTRALYGSHTAWRLETSDRPIFATYSKGDCRNIRFRLHLSDGTITELEQTDWCEARYTPGRRSYALKDKAWGADALIKMAVLASQTEETVVWQIETEGFTDSCSLEVVTADIKQAKLSRSGDMGVDPPDCFDPADDGSIRQTLTCHLSEITPLYICIEKNELRILEDESAYADYETTRAELAGRIKITTPDPYINTLGGALAVAADGIWGEEGVWLHGAVGWRMPLNGWRAAYTGDALGWHDRARTHFDNYAASQVTDVPCTIPHPAQDSTLALARSVKQWGTPLYSNGYICRNPRRNDQMNHYDMNLCYIDELLWHLNWTGDIDYARKMWNVIKLHLAWEKMNFDPDDDGLYDAYACIWASDALYYNSGAVTHSSAYNYRANRLAALIAEKIGEDSTPYRKEADKILNAINTRLWLRDKGHWAEFQDFMGHGRLHETAAVWTVYHAIDSDVANPFQAYSATRYVDDEIPHIPIEIAPYPIDDENLGVSIPKNAPTYSDFNVAAASLNAENNATISTTNWLPYAWSTNNVAFAEVMHTSLAYFQAGRTDEAFKLLKSSVLDGMYLGNSPGNFGQISHYDAARGECYRDFGDPIGVASRVLVQGLFGVLPDALNGRLLLRPGFPSDWNYASLHTPDIDFDFNIEGEKENLVESFTIIHHLTAVKTLDVQFPAIRSEVASVTVNGKETTWILDENAIGRPMLSVSCSSSSDERLDIIIRWKGEPLAVPEALETYPESRLRREGKITFVKMEQGEMKWWTELKKAEDGDTLPRSLAKSSVVLGEIATKQCVPVVIDNAFNANVTDIFNNQYLSPRSPYTTLQIPVQGIGDWCSPLKTAVIDDKGVRESISNGVLNTALGIPFRSPSEGQNIAFTSLWDNYPDSLSIPLSGKASQVYLLLAGSTNQMQCNIENGIVRIYYKDGSFETLPLVNPINWSPIEQIFFEDGLAFNRNAPAIQRLSFKTAEVSDSFGEKIGFEGANCEIDGGAAEILRMPLDKNKKLSHLVLETLSNEVVIGIMAITLQK